MTFLIFGKSVVGESHIKVGRGLDDASGYLVKENIVIAVAADGAGSARLSKIGADTVVSTFLEKLKQIEELTDPEEFLKTTAEDARKAIERISISESLDLGNKESKKPITIKDYATTLLVFLGIGENWYTAHIGDGAIVLLSSDQFRVVSQPYRSEYVNETVFLTSDNYTQFLDIQKGEGFQKVFIFTDGIQRGVLEPNEGEMSPFLPFFDDISIFIDTVTSEDAGSKEIEKLLLSEQMKQISDDDKTLLIVVRRDEANTL